MAVINGTRMDDVLLGTNGADIIKGIAGDDLLHGRGGADRLLGGTGNDTLSGDPHFGPNAPRTVNGWLNELFGEDGEDVLEAGNGDYARGDRNTRAFADKILL